MSAMVDHVARAIRTMPRREGGCVDYEDVALAAINALREPTAAMVEAGFKAPSRGMNLGEATAATWQAMIDAALAESDK